VTLDGVLAAVGVELVCNHGLPFVVCNKCYASSQLRMNLSSRYSSVM
jgi:hypothetical protein